MANPLTPPDTRAESSSTGRDARTEARRQESERIVRMALNIFAKSLPEMLGTPADASRFAERWPSIDDCLKKQLKSEVAYRKGYSWLCKKLEAGNRQGLWSVDVPSPFIMLRRRSTTRTLRWNQYALQVAAAENEWLKNLTLNGSPRLEGLFARLLLSMVLYGGFNRPCLWPALVDALREPRPLRGDSSTCWLSLSVPPDARWASNQYRWNRGTETYQAVCEFQYFPDPISLGLLRQFLKLQASKRNWTAPTTRAACLELMNRELKKTFSQQQLCYGAVTVAENLSGIDLPQVLVEYATGRQSSASLPSCYWRRLLDSQMAPVNEHSYSEFTIAYPLGQRKPSASRKKSASQLLSQLNRVFREDPAKRKTKLELVNDLKLLAQASQSLPETVLLHWLINHLHDRGNARSTAKRYAQSIAGEWLLASVDKDLETFDSEDFQDLYLLILNRPGSLQDRAYRAARLEDLHLFGVQQFEFPPLPERLQQGSASAPHVSAAIVDEPLFAALLNQISRLQDITPVHRGMLKCFLIMAYRTALRPGELVKLRLQDVEPSEACWLFVRNNKFGSNKTEAAKRKVPLMPLLTTGELALVSRYLQHRRMNRGSDAELVFHQPENPRDPLDVRSLSRAVRTLLGELSGGLYYRLYHLRHSALSRLQLLLHHDRVRLPAHVDALLPYSSDQRRSLLELICGRLRLRDRYLALAVFAGHSSPEITLSTYLHFSDLLLGLLLQPNNRELSAVQGQALLGLRPYRIRQMQKNGSPLTPEQVAGFLRKRLSTFIQTPPASTSRSPESQSLSPMSLEQTDYDKALAVLGKLQAGHDHRETAWFYQVSAEDVDRWHRAALALRDLKTERGHPRLFPLSRCHQLLPPEPVEIVEKRELADAYAAYRQLCSEPTSETELRLAIGYTLTHCNSSHSGIRFDDPKALKRYMAVVSAIYPWPRWQLLVKAASHEAISEWRCGRLSIQQELTKQQRRFKQGVGTLKLRHVNETSRREAEKAGYASNCLRTLFHRLAIVLFTAEEIGKWDRAYRWGRYVSVNPTA